MYELCALTEDEVSLINSLTVYSEIKRTQELGKFVLAFPTFQESFFMKVYWQWAYFGRKRRKRWKEAEESGIVES